MTEEEYEKKVRGTKTFCIIIGVLFVLGIFVNISQQNYAGTDPKTVLSFTLKDKHYTPILVQAKKITLSCKNNGDYY